MFFSEDLTRIIIHLLSFGHLYRKLQKLQSHALQMLRVLHPVDKVTAHDLGDIRIWKIRTNYVSRGLLLAEDLLVALGSTDMLAVVIRDKACAIEKTNKSSENERRE